MTEPPFRLRPANLKDLDRLGELYLDLGHAYEAADASYRRAIDAGRPWREHLVEGLKEDRMRIPVTLSERGHIVSFVIARAAPAPIGSALARVGLIEGAFVEEAYRRQGRLRASVADAMRWFDVKGVPWVELLADLRDATALAAWHRLGFVDFQTVMRAHVAAR